MIVAIQRNTDAMLIDGNPFEAYDDPTQLASVEAKEATMVSIARPGRIKICPPKTAKRGAAQCWRIARKGTLIPISDQMGALTSSWCVQYATFRGKRKITAP